MSNFNLSITFFFQSILLLIMFPGFSTPKKFDSHNVEISSFLPSLVCNQSNKGYPKQGSSLLVLHKYNPCIQHETRNTKATQFSVESQEEMLRLDHIRVGSMHTRFSKNSGKFKETKTDVPLQSGTSLGSGNYVVTVGIGTPKKDITLIFDTGSEVTWTQCEPCVGSCYKQNQPIFDPRKSYTYKNVSCSSPYCKLLPSSGVARGCFASKTCGYQVKYGDGSTSIGFFATEKLTVSTSDIIDNFYFGCGQQNSDQFGQTAGILALGPMELSFPAQTAAKFKKIFSYCIPSRSSYSGHLTFAGKFPTTVKFTPSSPDFEDSPYYGVDIDGINVGGKRLAIDGSIFANSGAVIDSGTVITRLQATAYAALRSAFQEYMKDYPKADGFSILDTCYDFSGYDKVSIPKIVIMFKGGVVLEIVPAGVFVAVNGVAQICLAFAPNSDDSDFAIIGNIQQKTVEVVHDLARGKVGFAPNGCN